MPQHAEITQLSNYTLLKLIRIGIPPLSAMIGTSAYYGQLIGNPVLVSINALLFSKKLGIDIWNLNQIPSIKTKLLNSSKKIFLGLGTISLVNYAKFTNNINPIEPTTTPSPITTSTTTVNPFPDLLLNNTNTDANHLMDWDTYISLNSYGIANLLAGITELIPSKFENIRKIANMATGGCLISSGVAMGINNDFNNAYAIPTIIAGASEIIHNLLPMETTNHIEEMQETTFNNETARLVNDNVSQYGSDNMSEVSLNFDNASLNWDYNHMSL
ncbi:hypothetical protein [Spiroplasma endosymbiont of Zeiraphera isertana]|uniref:hypothetical protein n=1 Tax=Spiroplasma endosymbiont of Zeiraphera isertana TaxID=3066313 RepID=UPI00313AD1B8